MECKQTLERFSNLKLWERLHISDSCNNTRKNGFQNQKFWLFCHSGNFSEKQTNKQANRYVFMKIISIYYRNKEFLHLINLGKRLEAMLQGEQTEQHRAASPAQSLRLLL